MEKFDYYKWVLTGESGDDVIYVYSTITDDYELGIKNAVDIVRKKVREELENGRFKQPFNLGISMKEKWEKTDKIMYVERKGNNCYLGLEYDVYIIREEVKSELEKVFGKELAEYVEFLDLKLVDLETRDEITDIGKWYGINVLKVIDGICEYKIRDKNGEMHWETLIKDNLKNKDGTNKHPIFRIKESTTFPIVSQEFVDVIEKFHNYDNLRIYNFSGVPYIEDLELE